MTKSAICASVIVGTSGAQLERAAPVVPRILTRPASTWGMSGWWV
jgi:hypothetical protein